MCAATRPPRGPRRPASKGERVGVEQQRYVDRGGVEDREPRVLGASTRADDPGLRASRDADASRLRDGVGPGLDDLPVRRPAVAHVAGEATPRAAGGEHGGTGVELGAGAHADDAARVLVVARAGPSQDVAGQGVVDQDDDLVGRGEVEVEADVDHLEVAGQPGAVADEQAGLQRADHRAVGVDRTVGVQRLAAVGVDAAGQVDREHQRIGLARHGRERRRRLAQGCAPADAEDAVEHEVGARDQLGRTEEVGRDHRRCNRIRPPTSGTTCSRRPSPSGGGTGAWCSRPPGASERRSALDAALVGDEHRVDPGAAGGESGASAYSASPPLSPLPTRSTTREPLTRPTVSRSIEPATPRSPPPRAA